MTRKFFWWAVAAIEATGCGLFVWTATGGQSGDLKTAAALIALGPALLTVLAVEEVKKGY